MVSSARSALEFWAGLLAASWAAAAVVAGGWAVAETGAGGWAELLGEGLLE